MKKMTCKDLGGACSLEFEAETFEEMSEKAKKHGIEMVQKGDIDHKIAMNKMVEKMNNPEEMQKWMDEKIKEFNERSI